MKILKQFLHIILLIVSVTSIMSASTNQSLATNISNFNDLPLFQPFREDTNETGFIYTESYTKVYKNKIDPRYEKIVTEFAYLQVFAIGTIGVISLLPESVSKWTDEDKEYADAQDLLRKHAENISKGPVWDEDTWQINYIGHAVAGSYFYVWGRQSGLTWQESAILTTLMSTFYWEYGWEAFAEIPSIQDLIVTPLLGSLLGEGTNYLYNRLMENNGEIYDSVILGSIGRGLLNPIGEMNKFLDQAFETANIEISIDYAYIKDKEDYALQKSLNQNGINQSYFKLNFTFKY